MKKESKLDGRRRPALPPARVRSRQFGMSLFSCEILSGTIFGSGGVVNRGTPLSFYSQLLGVQMIDGRPFFISRELPASLAVWGLCGDDLSSLRIVRKKDFFTGTPFLLRCKICNNTAGGHSPFGRALTTCRCISISDISLCTLNAKKHSTDVSIRAYMGGVLESSPVYCLALFGSLSPSAFSDGRAGRRTT